MFQYGLIHCHSMEQALLDIVNTIQSNMEVGSFSCGIFIDLKKAFDTVDNSILPKKLEFFGFRGIINDWLESYLRERTQVTVEGQNTSNKTNILCAVPGVCTRAASFSFIHQ